MQNESNPDWSQIWLQIRDGELMMLAIGEVDGRQFKADRKIPIADIVQQAANTTDDPF